MRMFDLKSEPWNTVVLTELGEKEESSRRLWETIEGVTAVVNIKCNEEVKSDEKQEKTIGFGNVELPADLCKQLMRVFG